MKRRVQTNWLQNTIDPGSSRSAALLTPWLRLRSIRDGTVKDIKISQTSGNLSMDNSGLRALMASNPMPALPPDYSRILRHRAFRFRLEYDKMKYDFPAHRQRFKYMEEMVFPRLLRSSLFASCLFAAARHRASAALRRTGFAPAPAWAWKNRASRSPTFAANPTPPNRIRRSLRKWFATTWASAASSMWSAPVSTRLRSPSIPSELRYIAWTDSPVNAHFVAFGNLVETPGEVAIQAWFYDVTNPSSQAVIAKIYRGTPTDPQVRKFAHQFADEIIMRLSGGLPGISSTQIAFVSSRGGAKEIWAMDYDGANQHPLTSLHSISLTPRWSPDSFAHRFHLLRHRRRRSGQSANLHVLGGRRQSRELSALQGHQQRAGVVAGRLAESFFRLPWTAIRNFTRSTPAAAA